MSEPSPTSSARLFGTWLASPGDEGAAALPLTDPSLPVLVVGAGPAGLAAMAALGRRQIEFQCVESHDGIGGIWDETNPVSSVYEGMRTAAPRSTSYLIRPMPRHWPLFVPLPLAKQYLDTFADEEDIRRSIRFQTRFIGAEKLANGKWRASFAAHGGGPAQSDFRAIIIATGSHNLKHATLDEDLRKNAEAAGLNAIHSAQYRGASDYAGRRVLIIGAGASATDIAGKLCGTARRTFISIRSHPWIVPASVLSWLPLLTRFGIVPERIVDDESWIPEFVRSRVFAAALRLATRRLDRYGFRRPKHGLFDQIPVMDRGFLAGIRAGRIEVRSEVKGFADGVAEFAAHADEPVDDVIFATGFSRHYPLYPTLDSTDLAGVPQFYLFHPSEPGLAFMTEVIGAGSCWPVFAEQGRTIAAYYAAEKHNPGKAIAFNARRRAATPNFKGKFFTPMDVFHIDYQRYVGVLRRLTNWLDN